MIKSIHNHFTTCEEPLHHQRHPSYEDVLVKSVVILTGVCELADLLFVHFLKIPQSTPMAKYELDYFHAGPIYK